MKPRPTLLALLAVLLVLAATAGAITLLASDGDETLSAADSRVRATDAPPEPSESSTTSTVTPSTASSSSTTTTVTTRPATTITSTPTSPTPPPPTTVAGRPPSRPPVVRITSPASGSRFEATYDPARENFAASVGLSAAVSDPDGDDFTVEWYSSIGGYLGSGQSITARLRPQGDASQPVITAVATDVTGARGEASVQIVVWILSDQ